MLLYVDEMLGKLCIFLRIMGEKCVYLGKGSIKNNPSLTTKTTNSVLITRNKKNIDKLMERIMQEYGWEIKKVVLLPYTDVKTQVVKLRELGTIELKDPRCGVCGGKLTLLSGEEVDTNKIPPKVLEHHTTFYYCSYCDKYFWKGKHWENICEIINIE